MSETQEIQIAEDICDKLFGRESVADLAKRVILADIIAARDAAIRADEARKWQGKVFTGFPNTCTRLEETGCHARNGLECMNAYLCPPRKHEKETL
jgi:hypothetical protein